MVVISFWISSALDELNS